MRVLWSACEGDVEWCSCCGKPCGGASENEAQNAHVRMRAQPCPTLCHPADCSLPGSSVHGILQARILQWVPMSSSRGSSQPRDRTRVSCLLHWQTGSLPLVPPRKPQTFTSLIYLNGKLIHTHTHTHRDKIALGIVG